MVGQTMTNQTWSGVVMTHPGRAHRQNWFHEWPRVVDTGVGLTRNFCAALRCSANAGSEWSMVAQDDVEPCGELEIHLCRVLGDIPDGIDVVSFFSIGRVRDLRDVQEGMRWRKRRKGELLWILLVGVRTRLAYDVADGVERQSRPADYNGGRHLTTGCDERLSLWLDANGVKSATHLPSLVQHRGESSLAGHGWTIGGRPRQSPTYRDAHVSELCGWSR
jgi:hypothetical protein